MELLDIYRPPTKLREDNVFTGVCLSTGAEYLWSHVLSRGVNISGREYIRGVLTRSPGPGIQWDMVD